MTLQQLVAIASDKTRFQTVDDYIRFAQRYLDFVFGGDKLQAVIVSQNEPHYRFFQYKKDGYFNIIRPINSPNMASDPLLNQHIRTIDHFFCTDLWQFAK
ncbi:MAG: hypothetical protein ACYC26_11450 [Phycisphaerales bacterium]